MTTAEAIDATGPGGKDRRALVRRTATLVTVAACALTLSACSLHIGKKGFSGDILGHKISGAEGQLPAGFPSDIPTPTGARVLGGGGGSDNNTQAWDAAFAVTTGVAAAQTAYLNQLKAGGYTISNLQAPETGSTGSLTTAAGSGSTSTTITGTAGTFTATNPTWTINVITGKTSSGIGEALKPGETGINITATPTTKTTTTN
jgi:hypothetical protein